MLRYSSNLFKSTRFICKVSPSSIKADSTKFRSKQLVYNIIFLEPISRKLCSCTNAGKLLNIMENFINL